MVLEDEEQWERFCLILRDQGGITNLSTLQVLIDFVKERERTLRFQEEKPIPKAQKQRKDRQQPKQRSLRPSFVQLGNSVGDSIKSVRDRLIGALKKESFESLDEEKESPSFREEAINRNKRKSLKEHFVALFYDEVLETIPTTKTSKAA